MERAGQFRAELLGSKEVTLIQTPSESSQEQTDPIAISHNREDQLHCEIIIPGRLFPLGSPDPIAFKLTPLVKVQCHRVTVFLTENIQYFADNKRVHQLEPTRKVQLFEKRADRHSVSAYPGSSIRITAGGEVAYDHPAAGDEEMPRDPTNLVTDSGAGSIGAPRWSSMCNFQSVTWRRTN